MSAKLLLGKPCVESMREQICKHAESLGEPRICAIGFDEPRWNQYSASIMKSAATYGFECDKITLDEDSDPNAVFDIVAKAGARKDVCGVIVQQPLRKRYQKAVEFIPAEKDIDCLNPLSVCKMYSGEDGFRPATPSAVINLLDYYGIAIQGKRVVIVGRGNTVGKPLALIMLQRNATVTVCHTKTVDLPSVCRSADILVSACGVPALITADCVTDKTVVIDVGLSFVDGKTRGDVAEEVYDKCFAVSPVPGGVGPVTRSALFLNALAAAENK